MICGMVLAACNNDDDIMLRDMLCGNLPNYEWQSNDHPNRTGTAKEILVGGNMCTFTPRSGSPYDFTSQGDIILFVEEIGLPRHSDCNY